MSGNANGKSRGRWAGKWALVTGASAGIGWALAEQLAAGGANLVLTARRIDRLQKLAADLSAKHGIKAEAFAADLAQPGAPREIYAFTTGKGIEIELLINNAGFGVFGYIHEDDEARLLEMVQVNCAAVVQLTRLYTPKMVQRRHGDVMIVASTAARFGGAVHCGICGDEGVRPDLCRGNCRGVAAIRRPRVRAVPRIDHHGVPAGRPPARSRLPRGRNGRQGGARGPRKASRRERAA